MDLQSLMTLTKAVAEVGKIILAGMVSRKNERRKDGDYDYR